MNNVKVKCQRLALTALTLALVCLFLLPVQAFAEDSIDAGAAPQVTSTESSAGESGSAESSAPTESVQPDTSGNNADVPAADEPAPTQGKPTY